MKYYIYALCDPITNEIRYIGQTQIPKLRYKDHINRNGHTHKFNWIKSLKCKGLKPVMQIIDIATELDWKTKEQYWISIFPNLTNQATGGEGNVLKELKVRGDNHPNSKLTSGKVQIMLDLYKHTNLSCRDLERLFNINRTSIQKIINGKSWQSVNNGIKTISLIKKPNSTKYGRNDANKYGNMQGEKIRTAKLKECDVIEIKTMLKEGFKIKDIAVKYNVSGGCIGYIKTGKNWKHINV